MYLLASEALVLATLGGGVGVVLGYIMAAALLPGVAATLSVFTVLRYQVA